MMRRTGQLASKGTSAAVIAAALLMCAEAAAVASGGGPLRFFDNIFTGTLSKGSQAAPSGQRAATSAQAQAAPTTSSAPLPWSGEDGASGHPLMTPRASRDAGGDCDQWRRC